MVNFALGLSNGIESMLANTNLDKIELDETQSDSDSSEYESASETTPSEADESARPSIPSIARQEVIYDDTPPAFPSIYSAQRQTVTAPTLAIPTLSVRGLMAPPVVRPAVSGGGGGGGLMVPLRTSAATAPQGVGGASGASINNLQPKRKKVALAPGCSALDWARLKKSTDLRGGVTQLLRVTRSELKKHNTKEDAWSAFYGKVYNITPYLRFHPGGEDDLMRVAGRDGTKLFALTHSWINIDAMIDTAMVGILVND